MRIAILGTRGIPNFHGGFEQFAEYFSVFLQEKGHDVYVYNSSLHPYKKNNYKGVNLIHCKDPEDKIGAAGQFIYDLNCILDSRKRKFDVILQLGYTSSSIWYSLLPKSSVVVINMDGLEWKRSKYSKIVQIFLKFAERLAVIHNKFFLISDSIGIQEYISKKYKKYSEYIPYGASIFSNSDQKILEKYKLVPYSYHLLIARMEPENNIEIIIKGVIFSQNPKTLVIIGNYEGTSFGRYLYKNYKNNEKIKFMGAIYDINDLNNLRYFSDLYFHGHSVGGTNPSLLEAMASECLIVAHDNIFNRSILEEDAFYFSNENEIIDILHNESKIDKKDKVQNNIVKIKENYTLEIINHKYLKFIQKCLNT